MEEKGLFGKIKKLARSRTKNRYTKAQKLCRSAASAELIILNSRRYRSDCTTAKRDTEILVPQIPFRPLNLSEDPMISRKQEISGGSLGGVKKKQAPPRPPPPASDTIRTSQSFRTAGELQGQKIVAFSQRSSQSVDQQNQRPSDLIDFATPPGSPEVRKNKLVKWKEPADFMYRVGASIFYLKSQLKNSSSTAKPVPNPFSPPRPSPQALMASPGKHALLGTQKSSVYGNVPLGNHQQPTTTQSSTAASANKYNPTIIKRLNENNNTIKPSLVGGGGSVRSSTGSSDWSDYSINSKPLEPQPRYGNLPPTWDEPPAQNPPRTSSVVLPTIIKPPSSSKPDLLPKPCPGQTSIKELVPRFITSEEMLIPAKDLPRNYYDDPPGDDSDFDDEDDLNDSVASPPMPSEPPPPPPVGLEYDEWVEAEGRHFKVPERNKDRPYAVALFDYAPGVDGDLPMQIGDLIDLIRIINDDWLYGSCAGVEGMFPKGFVQVCVPLAEVVDPQTPPSSAVPEDEPQPQTSWEEPPVIFTTAMYRFDAQTESDLSLRPGDMVRIHAKFNEDWLYGEVCGVKGQFPASYVDPLPSEIPLITNGQVIQ